MLIAATLFLFARADQSANARQQALDEIDRVCLARAGVQEDAAVAGKNAPRLEGSYELLVCRGDCGATDRTRAYLTGTLVLTDRSLAVKSLPADTREDFEGHFYWFYSHVESKPEQPRANGCFVLEPQKPVITHAGLIRAGLTRWQRNDADAIELPLYRSPDAGYEVTLRQFGTKLVGHGESWGIGSAEIDAPPDCIIATRVGAADTTACVEGMREEQRRPKPWD